MIRCFVMHCYRCYHRRWRLRNFWIIYRSPAPMGHILVSLVKKIQNRLNKGLCSFQRGDNSNWRKNIRLLEFFSTNGPLFVSLGKGIQVYSNARTRLWMFPKKIIANIGGKIPPLGLFQPILAKGMSDLGKGFKFLNQRLCLTLRRDTIVAK